MNIVLTLVLLLFAGAVMGVGVVTSSHIEEMTEELVQSRGPRSSYYWHGHCGYNHHDRRTLIPELLTEGSTLFGSSAW